MSRSARLLDLLQLLRGCCYPVSAEKLAVLLGVSQRTLYRDIAALVAMGADIKGEAGVGYVLEPGFLLPPLMFTYEELEALVLGADYVASHTDEALSKAALSALTRITEVLPERLRRGVQHASLMAGPPGNCAPPAVDPTVLRKAIRDQTVLEIGYKDGQDRVSQRSIWPFAMAYFESAQILVAWCVLRSQYRHFRLDRIETLNVTTMCYPRRKEVLLKEWHQVRGAEEKQAPDRI